MAVTLVAAACGDDSDTTTVSSTTTTEPPASTSSAEPGETTAPPTSEPVELTATHRGVTAETITVGISLLDIDPLYEAGLYASTWGDQELVWQTLIDDINARGGVNGRDVEAVIEFYNPADTVGAEQLCVRFTEDIEVFAVLGGFLGPAEAATPCLSENEELMLVGGSMTEEFLSTATAAWYSESRRKARGIEAFFRLLEGEGRLDSAKVAVVSGDENEADTNNVVIPALQAREVEIVERTVNDVIGTDIPAEDTLWDVIAERIRTAGADAVLVNGDTTAAIRGIARNGLDVEVWVLEQGQLASLGDSVDRDDADGAITIQGLTDTEAWDEPLMQACRQTFGDANPEVEVQGPDEIGLEDPHWNTALGQACRVVSLFEVLVDAAGPVLTPDTVRSAADGVGEFGIPTVPNASLAPGKPE